LSFRHGRKLVFEPSIRRQTCYHLISLDQSLSVRLLRGSGRDHISASVLTDYRGDGQNRTESTNTINTCLCRRRIKRYWM
jgi:hypothetical protein